MNKYIKDSLKDHKQRMSAFRRKELKAMYNKILKQNILLIIITLSIAYCLISGAVALLPSINKTTDIARNWVNNELQRTNCYDLLQYQKAYPKVTLNEQSEMLCSQYR